MVYQKRLRIGIVFSYGSNWLGGVYYIKSIINSFQSLEDEKKPQIIMFVTPESEAFLSEFEYEYLEILNYKPVSKYLGYIYSWVLRKNLYLEKILTLTELDGLFPVVDLPIKLKHSKTKIASWYPDLQHKFYSKYFSKLNLLLRDFRVKLLLKNTQILVTSSNNVLDHYKKFYTIPHDLKICVLPFVSNIQKSKLNPENVKKQYGIVGDYFIVCNQFYEHKNHKVVFYAIKKILEKGLKVQVIFTGKFEDYKNPKYIDALNRIVEDSGISKSINILGVIPREEQICLMQSAISVIQPSLFEGWSTVVEDVKTLQIPIIVSNIPVHIEQLGNKGFYFESTNPDSLSDLMQHFINKTQGNILYFDNYEQREKAFAENFISIFAQ